MGGCLRSSSSPSSKATPPHDETFCNVGVDVYPTEREFVAWSTDLMVELRNREDRLRYEIEDEDDGGESPSVGGKNDLARVKRIPGSEGFRVRNRPLAVRSRIEMGRASAALYP